jgi:putative tricarboxylic transport membrane protein
MPRYDQQGLVSGGMYVVLGAATAAGSLQYPVGNFWRMGPGFFPLLVSGALVVTGLVVAAIAVVPGTPAVALGRWRLRNLALVAAAVTAFGILVRPGGVILAAAALIAIASFTTSGLRPRDSILALACLSLLTWVVFIRMIGLQLTMLPRGLGF